MIDLKYMEKNFDEVVKKLRKRNLTDETIENIKFIFKRNKEFNRLEEELNAKKNANGKEFGQRRRDGLNTEDLVLNGDKIKEDLKALENKRTVPDAEFKNIIKIIPNLPDENVKEGKDENDNVEIKRVLVPRVFDFEPKPHWDLAEGRIDFKKGVKLAKARFSVLTNKTARIERALINFFLDENGKRGFQEVSVPVINNRKMLEGTGQLPKFEDDLFKIEGEDLFLIPTGEVPLTNLFNDEILDKNELPILVTANTPCFRKEAGSAGRDTRGIIRQHQFNKVEMVAITTPEQSEQVFKMMIKNASDLLTKLELPHRIVELCTGDLGFSATKTVDLEVWIPSEGKYREISSISHTGDFQARRAKIRYKDGKKNVLVNTLNGSALAVGRTIVAIMENNQNEDGTIYVPEALKKYL